MLELMLKGSIKCKCGNEFWYESMREQIPCMACGKFHDNNGEPVPEPIEELTEEENE